MLDLDYGVSSVIGDRAFHRDPQVAAELARALVAGLREAGMGAVGKHFPATGGGGRLPRGDPGGWPRLRGGVGRRRAALPPAGRRAGRRDARPRDLRKIDPRPAGFSPFWLQEVLRGRLGFGGVIFSDDLTMEGASVAGDIVGPGAAHAGCDMVLVCNRPIWRCSSSTAGIRPWPSAALSASPPCARGRAACPPTRPPLPAGRPTARPATACWPWPERARHDELRRQGLPAHAHRGARVYRMIGEGEVVLYVGKAKNLKRRVSSYFQRTQLSPRIAIMVGQVVRVDTTATRSEAEALILENNLIKSLGPKYNILFRDDKSHPTSPSVGRRVSADLLPPGRLPQRRALLRAVPQLVGGAGHPAPDAEDFPPAHLRRTAPSATARGPCLLYQIQRCTGPCVGMIDKEAYAADVRLASLFLGGRHGDVVDDLSRRMQEASDRLAFEQAAAYRDQIRNLQAVLHKQFERAPATRTWTCWRRWSGRAGVRQSGDDPQRAPSGRPAAVSANAQGCAPLDALVAFVEQHYQDHPLPGRILVNLDPAPVREALEAIVDGKGGGRCRPLRERAGLDRDG